MEDAFWCIKELCISWKRGKTRLHIFSKMFLILRYLIESYTEQSICTRTRARKRQFFRTNCVSLTTEFCEKFTVIFSIKNCIFLFSLYGISVPNFNFVCN